MSAVSSLSELKHTLGQDVQNTTERFHLTHVSASARALLDQMQGVLLREEEDGYTLVSKDKTLTVEKEPGIIYNVAALSWRERREPAIKVWRVMILPQALPYDVYATAELFLLVGFKKVVLTTGIPLEKLMEDE